jgi:hypothetical protein
MKLAGDQMTLTAEQSAARVRAFEEAEASLRLEGLDPMGDVRYCAIKEHLIAGTISFDEAESAIKAQYGAAKSLAASA